MTQTRIVESVKLSDDRVVQADFTGRLSVPIGSQSSTGTSANTNNDGNDRGPKK